MYIIILDIFSHHMEESLASDDLIRKLCSQIDKSLYTENEETQPSYGRNSLPLKKKHLWNNKYKTVA